MKDRISAPILKSFGNTQIGSVALEFALFLPILILLSLAGLNISRYILFEGSVSKTADALANIITMSKPYSTKVDKSRVEDDDELTYLTVPKLRKIVNEAAPLLLRDIENNKAKIIVTSLRGEAGGGAAILWREDFEFGSVNSLGESMLDNMDKTDGSCVGICQTAKNMLPAEGMISIEVYQEFDPVTSSGWSIPIGARTLYASAGYSPRFGVLNCLHPKLSPYDGSC